MIDARELRIGNWVQGDPLDIPKLGLYHNGLTQIQGMGIQLMQMGNITSFIPIPITEDWFLRFGFEKCGSCHMKINLNDSYSYLLIDKDSAKYAQVCRNGLATCDAPCQYVHQLQNLYHALTGIDLAPLP